jgi:hypothetical protein
MSDDRWIHPGPISPLDCDEPDCGWRVHGVPDKYHASALARHVAEAHQPTPDVSARDDQAKQALSDAGAQCGVCGDQPGDRICPDCERCYEEYVAALRKAGWAPRAEVLHEAADVVGNDDDCACGGCDSCVPRKLADQLRRMADEAAS